MNEKFLAGTSTVDTSTAEPVHDIIVVGSGPWDGLTVHELFAQSFIAACSLGNDPRVLMILRNDMFSDSTALVV